ncbi:hypothetical protein L5515_009056 [Caenorhabditis briggsae]|uniref:Uncharacterized protein n=1 Tax=Caenorhabditis briggsae TaxID=6238 RepID=A0AAE9JLS8_CAEBR|nr:hypothetical protein L5515_009056 [Caenorhabditis briggsae]
MIQVPRAMYVLGLVLQIFIPSIFMKPTKKPVLVVVKGGILMNLYQLISLRFMARRHLNFRELRSTLDMKNDKNEFFDQQVILLCGAQIKTDCGFWKSLQTGKTFSEGTTSYDKNKGALVVENMGPGDFGMYSSARV